ncbi:hypothetical protein B296_00001633 [Ensete ventricosum]|uniref:Uncharacterized protein n=1 Tax=Ensete ventricosum TaxID=4639 RepID=A0A427B530_ENSVE|nr:hypothetical protein B296_00001633 [Ensete ventricosum]
MLCTRKLRIVAKRGNAEPPSTNGTNVRQREEGRKQIRIMEYANVRRNPYTALVRKRGRSPSPETGRCGVAEDPSGRQSRFRIRD